MHDSLFNLIRSYHIACHLISDADVSDFIRKALSITGLSLISYYLLVGQDYTYSESLVKYDLKTHTTDKDIPFDNSFTLLVDSLATENIKFVHIFEAEIINSKRALVTTTIVRGVKRPIFDFPVNYEINNNSLFLYFPPIKPNSHFDIHVVYELPSRQRNLLLKVNSKLAQNINASRDYKAFQGSTISNGRAYASLTYVDYQTFFNSNLANIYTKLLTPTNYSTSSALKTAEVQAIGRAIKWNSPTIDRVAFLLEVVSTKNLSQIELGTIDIRKIYDQPNVRAANHYEPQTILTNLVSTKQVIDSIYSQLNQALARGRISVNVGRATYAIPSLLNALRQLKANISLNLGFVKTGVTNINQAINENELLAYGSYLALNSVTTDLKAKGGSILFLNAGLSNMLIPKIDNTVAYIPKVFLGVSIFFRPIDKNTRRNRFIRSQSLKPVTVEDFGILATRSIWQHLSLDIGFTRGEIRREGFENFFNSTSLLIGPSFRFARAFKVNAGLSLINSTSKNPLISEKKVTAGGHVSFSVDLDLLSGLTKITDIILK